MKVAQRCNRTQKVGLNPPTVEKVVGQCAKLGVGLNIVLEIFFALEKRSSVKSFYQNSLWLCIVNTELLTQIAKMEH